MDLYLHVEVSACDGIAWVCAVDLVVVEHLGVSGLAGAVLGDGRRDEVVGGDDGRMDCNVCFREYAGATLEQCYEWEIADACALIAKAALTPAGGGKNE
jgi:hypothetical protein